MENNYSLETDSVTMTVSEIAQILRIGRSRAYLLVRQAYEDTDNELFETKKIGQQYRVVTSSFFDWLQSKKK
jgi:hypothetical protein